MISIHALREEGDSAQCPEEISPSAFLSTPSARRATFMAARWAGMDSEISIHALREEGDCPRRLGFLRRRNFYPRPPRGGRPRLNMTNEQLKTISIHALREEGDETASHPTGAREISIHALREEGDCKNGEKYLRFCFIIKRSAQIWKSLSKNIRKNSCDLHRTA